MEDLDALLADLQVTSPTRCPVLLTDCQDKSERCEERPPPPPYDPQTALPFPSADVEDSPADKSHLYSTVKKCGLPSVPASVGGGLCELDRLLNELNATQFNITDEIMSQFPPREKNASEIPDERRALSASSATLELDRLMASLSDFHKQNTLSLAQQQPETFIPGGSCVGSGTGEAVYSPPKSHETSANPGEPEQKSSPLSRSGQEGPEETSHPKCTEPDSKSDLDSMMVKLQSGLKQQGIETLSKGLCESCQRPIAGQDIIHQMFMAGFRIQHRWADALGVDITEDSGEDSLKMQLSNSLVCLLQQICDLFKRHDGWPPSSLHYLIDGMVVTALGHTWHPEHFVCAHCKSLIGTTNFFEKDGRPYCERDYFSLYAPRCALCDLPILQNLVTALGRTWHPEHFCCKICRKPIGEEVIIEVLQPLNDYTVNQSVNKNQRNELNMSFPLCMTPSCSGFHEKDEHPYCSYDYYRLFGTVCAGCCEPVKESYISALNGLWHPKCFVCHVCQSPFLNGSFFENEGLPLCETHYHSCRGSLCAGCDQPITGRCVTAMGRKFHPQHLSCTFCLRQLNKGTFREQEGKPYCQACFARLYG